MDFTPCRSLQTNQSTLIPLICSRQRPNDGSKAGFPVTRASIMAAAHREGAPATARYWSRPDIGMG